jgi:hypothetical protein
VKVEYRGGIRASVDGVGSFKPGDFVDLPAEVAKKLAKTNPNFVLVKEKKENPEKEA